MTTINVTDDGFVIDGTNVGELELGRVFALLGEPRTVPVREGTAIWHYWDELGVRVNGIPDDPLGHQLNLLTDLGSNACRLWNAYEEEGDVVPEKKFDGQLLINGILFGETAKDQIAPKSKGVQVMVAGHSVLARTRRDEDGQRVDPTTDPVPWEGIFVQTRHQSEWIASRHSAPSRPEPTAEDYVVEDPGVELMTFSSLNWKLAVMQELMYCQEELSPLFDLDEFASFNIPNFNKDDYFDKIVPEAKAWFESYPIPLGMGELIEELELDGGCDIYSELLPSWDGETDHFVITSLTPEDLAQLPNLTTVYETGAFLTKEARKVLRKHDITVE